MSAGSVRARRGVLAALVIGGVLWAGGVFGATAAQAHNVLRSTDPADGSTVATAPEQITLTFDEPALALGTQIEVRSPDGTLVSAGDPVLVDDTVSEKLGGDLPAGDYTVAWRVTSADGHPITGQFTFTTTTATTIGDAAVPDSTPSPSPSMAARGDQESSGSSTAPVIVGGIAVVLVGAISWLLWRRRRPRERRLTRQPRKSCPQS